MNIIYDVNKEKGGRWYVFNTDFPNHPIQNTYRHDKKDALKIAARLMGISYKEYIKLRKSR